MALATHHPDIADLLEIMIPIKLKVPCKNLQKSADVTDLLRKEEGYTVLVLEANYGEPASEQVRFLEENLSSVVGAIQGERVGLVLYTSTQGALDTAKTLLEEHGVAQKVRYVLRDLDDKLIPTLERMINDYQARRQAPCLSPLDTTSPSSISPYDPSSGLRADQIHTRYTA